jgi:hypothetical protein
MPRRCSTRGSSSGRPCGSVVVHRKMPRQCCTRTASSSGLPCGKMEPHCTMPRESCEPATASSDRRPPASLCRGRTRGRPRARPGGHAADWDRIAICRGRARGGPRARPEDRGESWTRIAIGHGRAQGEPRARLRKPCGSMDARCNMPRQNCGRTECSSRRRPLAPLRLSVVEAGTRVYDAKCMRCFPLQESTRPAPASCSSSSEGSSSDEPLCA